MSRELPLTPQQRAEQLVVRALAALPPAVQVRLSGRPPVTIDGDTLAPEMQFTLAPAAAGTQVHYQAEMKGHGLMSLMTGTINRMMAKLDADLLDRLQAHLERRA